MYKVNNRLDSSTFRIDKDSREYEDNSDLQGLVDATQNLTGDELTRWIFENVEVSTLVNYLAVHNAIGNRDFGHKNMYWYHDSEGTGLWYVLPWDQDLSFGHNFTGNVEPPYFDNTLYTNSTIERAGNNLYLDPSQ